MEWSQIQDFQEEYSYRKIYDRYVQELYFRVKRSEVLKFNSLDRLKGG